MNALPEASHPTPILHAAENKKVVPKGACPLSAVSKIADFYTSRMTALGPEQSFIV